MRPILICLAVLLAATSAQAANQPGFYAGLEYNYSSFSYDDSSVAPGVQFSDLVEENFNGYAPYVGYQFNDTFAIEFGYAGTVSETGNATSGAASLEAETEYWSIYGDLLAMLPITDNLYGIGAVGYERINAKIDLTTTVGGVSSTREIENDTNAYRLGAGLEYAFGPNVGLRGMFRYVATDFSGIDNYYQGSVGLKYRF